MTDQLQELFGRPDPVALITGSGAPRVGRVIAKTLAESGFQIAIHFNQSGEEADTAVEEMQAAGVEAAKFQADLSEESESRNLVDKVHDRFESIDVVVNSAAIWEPKPLEEVGGADVDQYFQVNTASCFYVAQQAGLLMVDQPTGGAIINLGDWAPIRPYTDYAAYFISKGSITTLSRVLAVELATRNPKIRVNTILPGPVMIPDSMEEDKRQAIIHATLLKREGTPQNVADACRALVFNDFITGAVLPVDGGRSIYSPYNPV